MALQRLARETVAEIAQLALGAAAREVAVLQRGDAGRIVAAIFEAPQGFHDIASDRLEP
jgi:hypothetical protein